MLRMTTRVERVSLLLLQPDWSGGVKDMVGVEEAKLVSIKKSDASDIGRARPVGIERTNTAGLGRASVTEIDAGDIEGVIAIGVGEASADIVGWVKNPEPRTLVAQTSCWG